MSAIDQNLTADFPQRWFRGAKGSTNWFSPLSILYLNSEFISKNLLNTDKTHRSKKPQNGGKQCMKRNAVRRRVAPRCILSSIALLTFGFAQCRRWPPSWRDNVNGASQAQMSQTTPPTATSAEDLAHKLQNPVAALVSVQFQSKFRFWLGAISHRLAIYADMQRSYRFC